MISSVTVIIISSLNHFLRHLYHHKSHPDDCSLDWHPSDHISFVDTVHLRKLHTDSPVTITNKKTNQSRNNNNRQTKTRSNEYSSPANRQSVIKQSFENVSGYSIILQQLLLFMMTIALLPSLVMAINFCSFLVTICHIGLWL